MTTNTIDHIDRDDREVYELPAFPGVWRRGEYLLCLVDGDPESLRAQLIEADDFTGRTMVSGLRIPVDRLPRHDWRFAQPTEEFVEEVLGESIMHTQLTVEMASWGYRVNHNPFGDFGLDQP
ncbi:MAG TPA: hypothetical protein VMP01_06850 [Pirellulaceae bacterium]|nr:hypothetical protein [Pirellulaceae bacterium]